MIPTPSVFISHSKNDKQIVNYFSNIFANIGLRSLFYDWQNQPTSYAGQTITYVICHPHTLAVSVLLGKNLENPPFTSIYSQLGQFRGRNSILLAQKPIWIFEAFGSFASKRYPVPFVTDYAQYTLEDVKHLQALESSRLFR